MIIRERFERQLNELREDVLHMGSLVESQLVMALEALDRFDTELAKRVFTMDNDINKARFDIEEKSFALIVTQQPAARDLRSVVAVMNIIIDLERMGDQAKGIAKVIPHIGQASSLPHPPELQQMGTDAADMLHQALAAYAAGDVALAQSVAGRDDEVDALYASAFSQIMQHMAQVDDAKAVESAYEVLRVARELERFADLATNVAERVIYLVTGRMAEMNVDRGDLVG